MNQRRPYRSFVSYIDRSREYYAAQGYPQPYAWATHQYAPFTRLQKSLSECRIGLVTTAGREELEGASQGRTRELYAMTITPTAPRLYTAHLFWDKKATHTDDLDSFLPLNRLAEYAAEGRIVSVSPPILRSTHGLQPGEDDTEGCPTVIKMVPRGSGRRHAPFGALTGLPPDRESGCPAPGRKRPAHSDHGLGA